MRLHVRAGTAFRWRPTMLAGQASDVLRVLARDGVQLALLANGYECGFSTCWPPASRLILDLFVDEWGATTGSVRERLHASFEGARRKFIAQARSLVPPDADFPDDLPGTVLLAVAIEGFEIHTSWIGGDVAVLVRAGRAIVKTTPHTLVEQFKREHPEVSDLGAVPNVIVRRLAERELEQSPPDYVLAEAKAGDTLLLLSRAVFRGPCVDVDDAAVTASAHASTEELAEHLAERAFTETDAPYTAVVALRFDEADDAHELELRDIEQQP